MTRPPNPEIARRALEEAEQLLAAQGPAAIQMRDLARRVGVSATALYTYFSSKEELLAQLRLRVAEHMNARIRAIDPKLSPAEGLRELGVRYIEFAEDNHNFYKFLYEDPYVENSGITTEGSRAPLPEELSVLYYPYRRARAYLEQMEPGPSNPVHLPPQVGAMLGWMFLHGFSSLFIARRLQAAEGLDPAELKRMFLTIYGPQVLLHLEALL